MLELDSLGPLRAALEHLDQGFSSLPACPTATDPRLAGVLMEVAERMRDNFPYPHPLYAGQMLKPPHAIARLAYMLALHINPNNHALDGGRASSAMEKEAVAEIAAMFGFPEHLGHLTSGGTMANLEALWIAGQLAPGSKIAASAEAHYTHERICGVLQIPFQKIPGDAQARMDMSVLEKALQGGDVKTVVVTLGTSALGVLDPLDEVLDLRRRYEFRIHVDSAYGGYYRLADNLSARGQKLFGLLDQVDSIVIDPHKHGLQPYGCGCVLFQDPSVGRFYQHDSPYTYFSSDELHLGEISLECSRAGASAVALWATQRLMPLVRGGEFAERLQASRRAALKLHARLQQDGNWILPWEPELDILVWSPSGPLKARGDAAPLEPPPKASELSQRTRRIYQECTRRGLHLAVTQVPRALLAHSHPNLEWDQDSLACLRSCLMKPEHEAWVDRIYAILQASCS